MFIMDFKKSSTFTSYRVGPTGTNYFGSTGPTGPASEPTRPVYFGYTGPSYFSSKEGGLTGTTGFTGHSNVGFKGHSTK